MYLLELASHIAATEYNRYISPRSASLPPTTTIPPMSYPSKRRRTATSVLSGDFDPRPHRDVLTSLLNGVSMPKPTEEELHARRERKREKKEKERREREREKEKTEKK